MLGRRAPFRLSPISLLPAVLLAASCGADDPKITDPDGEDEVIEGSACSPEPIYTENISSCIAPVTDYQPRDGETGAGDWPDCISDDNVYHRIEPSISSIARVEAYDAIGALLWQDDKQPSSENFLQARIVYEEEQGIGSRVARRFDPHYEPPEGGSCDEEGVAAANPDYCVGPATLLPIIVDAFADGIAGNNRLVNAARIQAALQWFLYVSAVKEATTCTAKAKDCDSSWAYYSGGTERSAPIGLAADIQSLAPQTHERVYDGLLAVRCWRDLENNDTGEATAFLERRDQAIGQLDRALVRGMAILIRQHFAALDCSTDDYRDAHLSALEVLTPLFDRETRARDAATADLLSGETAQPVDTGAVLVGIDGVYGCP